MRSSFRGWASMISTWSVAGALVLGAAPVQAADTPVSLFRVKREKVTPSSAATKRSAAEARGKALVDSGESIAAGIEFDNAASEHGDPVLYLDAGEAYLTGAEKSRNKDLAFAAKERAFISLDILYFHLDSTADKNFRLVEATQVPSLIVRAQDLLEDADITIEEIEDEERAAAEKPRKPGAPPKKPRKKGRAAKITGAVFIGTGAVFLGVGAAGIALGVKHQQNAEHPTIYGDEYDAIESKGERSNMMAIVGLPTGVGLVGIGVTILVLSARKNNKKKRKKKSDQYSVVPTMDRRGGGGVAVVGRF